MNLWSSFPRRWVFERLPKLTAGQAAGAHMAALRVYLALALDAEFRERVASLSLTDLQHATGLSRPMVTKGITTAVSIGLISVDGSEYRHSYRLLTHADDSSFAKIPTSRLRAALPKLPTRGFHALDSLKVYVTLLLVRPRSSFRVPISVRRLASRSGVQARRVRAAIDVLINHRLIHVVAAESDENGGRPHNEYLLLGFESIGRAAEAAEANEFQNSEIGAERSELAGAHDSPF